MQSGGREGRFRVEPLRPDHNRTAFSCGVEPLDRYLKVQAGQDARRNVAAPFVALAEDSAIVQGYYTLSMTSFDIGELPEELARKLPRYPNVPAVLLGRLAVHQNCKGTGLGKFLLMDALARSLRNEIAWAAVVVDAKNDDARVFYERYGFSRFPDRPGRLFIPHNKVREAFE